MTGLPRLVLGRSYIYSYQLISIINTNSLEQLIGIINTNSLEQLIGISNTNSLEQLIGIINTNSLNQEIGTADTDYCTAVNRYNQYKFAGANNRYI